MKKRITIIALIMFCFTLTTYTQTDKDLSRLILGDWWLPIKTISRSSAGLDTLRFKPNGKVTFTQRRRSHSLKEKKGTYKIKNHYLYIKWNTGKKVRYIIQYVGVNKLLIYKKIFSYLYTRRPYDLDI